MKTKIQVPIILILIFTGISNIIKSQETSKTEKDILDKVDKVFTKESLRLLQTHTNSSKDIGFSLFLKEGKKINDVLGANTAERKVRNIIGREEFDPFMKNPKKEPNWERIGKKVISLYGAIGEEKYYGARMIWAWQNEDWPTFCKYYPKYFKTAYARSEYHINNMSWAVFEHSNEPGTLKIACNVVKFNLEQLEPENVAAIDTYANLLYKLGQKNEAITWETKAVKLSSNENEFIETLEKMKLNIPTWPGTKIVVDFDEELDFAGLLKKVRSSKKMLMLDFTATWCAPCKKMDKYVYSDSRVGNVINQNFISAKVQIDKTSTDSKYIKSWYSDAEFLVKKYKIRAVPNLVFLTNEGTVVKNIVGEVSSTDLINIVNEILKSP